MTDAAENQQFHPINRSRQRRLNLLSWIGPLIVFAGAISYFAFFAYVPALRDFPWVNLPVIALGLLVSALGLRRAWVDATRSSFSRVFASVVFLLSLALTALFGAYIFFLSYQLPQTDGVVQVGLAAPDFALPDQHGQTVRLSELRGKKVVLDFYRGHW